MWVIELIKKSFPQRFRLARMTRLPLIGSFMKKMLFEGDELIFLPRDRVVQVQESPERHGDVVLPSRVVEHFIEQAEYHWVMDRCICRDAAGCEDYPVDLGCLFLGEATTRINPRLGRRVTKEEAVEHERRCREAGLVHMVGRNKLDSVWLNVRPGDRLMTICNCCNCCCLWRVLPDLSEDISEQVHKMPGVTVSVTDRCVGCGTCTRGVCFVNAVSLKEGRSVISDACRGCGRCVSVCPQGARVLTIEGDRYLEESIERVGPLVDLS